LAHIDLGLRSAHQQTGQAQTCTAQAI
jgi:hypothetical protein